MSDPGFDTTFTGAPVAFTPLTYGESHGSGHGGLGRRPGPADVGPRQTVRKGLKTMSILNLVVGIIALLLLIYLLAALLKPELFS
jgi:K+-transporting ATPase KdpF subunit